MSDLDLCIFHDIFRRADKNDDGAISWPEFLAYFSDGIMTDEGLQALFKEIDSHGTNNIDTQELCSYFSSRLGPHQPVFTAASALCDAVSASVKSLAQTHPSASARAQFIDRFLLREMSNHLEAQHRVLRNALHSLEQRGRDLRLVPSDNGAAGERSELDDSLGALRQQVSLPQQSRPAAYQRTVSAPPQLQQQQQQQQQSARAKEDSLGQLHSQVDKLQRLLDRLEARSAFYTGSNEEAMRDEEESLILVVRRRLTVQDEQLGTFHAAVKKYMVDLERVSACLFVSLRVYRETGALVIYEFWESLGSWRKFLPTSVSKELRRAIVDCSEAPETTESLLLPSEWWKQLER